MSKIRRALSKIGTTILVTMIILSMSGCNDFVFRDLMEGVDGAAWAGALQIVPEDPGDAQVGFTLLRGFEDGRLVGENRGLEVPMGSQRLGSGVLGPSRRGGTGRHEDHAGATAGDPGDNHDHDPDEDGRNDGVRA